MDGMDWHPQARDMFRGLVFLDLKKAESRTRPGMSLQELHAGASGGYRDGFGTVTQMHHELQSMVAEGLIQEVGKDFYRVVAGAKPPEDNTPQEPIQKFCIRNSENRCIQCRDYAPRKRVCPAYLIKQQQLKKKSKKKQPKK